MKWINMTAALAAMLLMSGCAGAAFNRIEFSMTRNITVGQELMDLQAAHEKGIISDSEYIEAKKDILNVVGLMGDIKE